jgi:hypothetical protein
MRSVEARVEHYANRVEWAEMSAEVEWNSHEDTGTASREDANFGEIVASQSCYAVQLPLELHQVTLR